MAGVAVADGFLGRWSQRKQAAAEGKPLAEPVQVPVAAPPKPASLSPTSPATPTQGVPATAADDARPPEPPVLSLDDVEALTADSSYAPFVNRSVAPEVRNAAMKKLFTDPHYNVMDGLDTYIDDYSLPDPLPAAMLRKMASAKFLKLFDDEDEAAKKPSLLPDTVAPAVQPEDALTPIDDNVPESARVTLPESDPTYEQTPHALDETPHHDHSDLRLQPNHAAGRQEAGHGTE